MAEILFASPGDQVCGHRHLDRDTTCERQKGHDVCIARASGGSDAWVVDHDGMRRMVAEEIAAEIEEQIGKAKAAHYKSALAKAARIARKHANSPGDRL